MDYEQENMRQGWLLPGPQQLPVVQAPQMYEQQSWLSRLSQPPQMSDNLRDVLFAAGTAMANGGRGFQQTLQNRQAYSQAEAQRNAQQNATLRYLQQEQASPSVMALAESGQMQLAMQIHEREKYAAKPNLPSSAREYEYARQAGDFKGSYSDFLQMKKDGVTVNNITSGPEKFYESLQKQSGELAADYRGQRDKAVALDNDMAILEEINKDVPSGALMGRLAETFPEAAGDKGQLFQSIINRNIGNFRVEGSGAQSDKEFEGILNAMPRLRGTPEGRALIIQSARAKAALDIERGNLVDALEMGDIDYNQYLRAMQELNTRSILPEGLQLQPQDALPDPLGLR